MKASEARLIAENKNRSEHRECFDKIMNEVKILSKNGYFEYTYFQKFPKSVEEELIELGYKIERKKSNYNELDTIISW